MERNCDWCGSKGHDIGEAKSFPGTRVAKCDVCDHEWEYRPESAGSVTGRTPTPWWQLFKNFKLRGKNE